MPHVWDPDGYLSQASTSESDSDDRPDPPDLDGKRCQIGGCGEPAKETCWSTKWSARHGTWFLYCEPHAEKKTAQNNDLEVVD